MYIYIYTCAESRADWVGGCGGERSTGRSELELEPRGPFRYRSQERRGHLRRRVRPALPPGKARGAHLRVEYAIRFILSLCCKHINRSHTHTSTENNSSDTNTRTRQEQHPKPPNEHLPSLCCEYTRVRVNPEPEVAAKATSAPKTHSTSPSTRSRIPSRSAGLTPTPCFFHSTYNIGIGNSNIV